MTKDLLIGVYRYIARCFPLSESLSRDSADECVPREPQLGKGLGASSTYPLEFK